MGTWGEKIAEKNLTIISSNPNSDEMKVKELINDIMAEKEVSGEKDSLISYEEISRDTETTFKKLLKEASKAPAPKQIGIGAACGWVSGYVMMKVGKAAATAVGGSLILLQIAHYKGYVTVDWNRITNDSSSFSEQVKDKLKIRTKSSGEKMMDFAKKNVYLAGGFTGGFFIGLASS